MAFLETFNQAEREYRAGLTKVEAALRDAGHQPFPADRAAILLRIGDREMRVTEIVREGLYLGTNASYNIERLVDAGLLDKAPCKLDARAVIVRLTPQGKRLRKAVLATLDGEG